MKKYIRPTMKVMNMLQQCEILAGSDDVVKKIESSTGVQYGGEGNEPARVKESNIWDAE